MNPLPKNLRSVKKKDLYLYYFFLENSPMFVVFDILFLWKNIRSWQSRISIYPSRFSTYYLQYYYSLSVYSLFISFFHVCLFLYSLVDDEACFVKYILLIQNPVTVVNSWIYAFVPFPDFDSVLLVILFFHNIFQ